MSKAATTARVQLIDDHATFRRVMSSELTRRGYDVVTAASGREALEQAAQVGADVTLLDLRLPDMDGIQVLEGLRERNPSAGVVVLTGHGTIDTAIRAVRLGAYAMTRITGSVPEGRMSTRPWPPSFSRRASQSGRSRERPRAASAL